MVNVPLKKKMQVSSPGPKVVPRPKQERRPQKFPVMERRLTRTRRWPICLTSWEGVELHDWEIPRFMFSFIFLLSFLCYVIVLT